ncbi:SDR family oxidoreductase [Amycolatopsis japonica]|uniref:SDR family oxidoreductase n=1 Tax=Amycolatopsis japonica TaxID=208439 RepID=UPI00366B3F56
MTGGAGGVGSAVVELLARRGAVVYLNCFHSFKRGKEIAESLTAEGLDVRLARGSVAKDEHVERIVGQIGDAEGRLDILVNNAALGIFGTAAGISEDDLDRALAVNLKAPLRCVQRARALLTASGQASVVNVSSVGARSVLRDYLAIGVTKAALEAMTRYLAVELAPDGIRVNTASAGLLDTPGGRMFPGYSEFASSLEARTPLSRRLGEADEFAELIAFLASPRSRWITGQTMSADGGLNLMCGDLPVQGSESVAPPVEPSTEDPIVVVGMGMAVPGASSPEEFWNVLVEGPKLFTEAAADRWVTAAFSPGRNDLPDKGSQPVSGLITDFRPHPRLAAEPSEDLDFSTLWLRHSLYQALENTSVGTQDRVAFCVGLTADGSQHLSETQVVAAVREALDGPHAEGMTSEEKHRVERSVLARFPRGAGDAARSLPHAIASDAIAGILPRDSTVHVVDTACSSSLYALDRGIRELRSGRCDVAVCGGSAVMQVTYMVAFSKMGGLSPTGEIRSLDEGANGVLFADGAGLVVLKKLSRALKDGDTVLGVVRGVGLSADGKGKAINAPATTGQMAAARRALDKAGTSPQEIDLVVAHATGTPTGDTAELLGIAEVYATDRPVTVVSNKSVIGHTGWPAGVVSLIHVLLCLRHDRIPPQHRFERLPARVTEQTTNIVVPRQFADWRRADRPRTAAVAAFGFGGTNATAVVSEYLPGLYQPAAEPPNASGPLAIIGWSACEPEGSATSFGAVYPVHPIEGVALPPPMMRRIDRAQLLALECMSRLPAPIRKLSETYRDTTGVLFGVMGQTGAMHGAQLRVHFDDIRAAAGENPSPAVAEFLDRMWAEVDGTWPAISADTQPGVMPNVIASRIANHFDLRGLNLVVDAGEAALLDSFETAARFLEDGDLDLALVGGMSANPYPAWIRSLRPVEKGDAEGAYLFAVTTAEKAEEWSLPVLAHVES